LSDIEMPGAGLRERMVAAGLWDAADARDPSRDLGAAWEIVQRLQAEGYRVDITVNPDGTVLVRLIALDTLSHAAAGDTAPGAVCRAALGVARPRPEP
jgi:hypothetical protein